MYALLRDGQAPSSIPEYPVPAEGDAWTPDVAPLKSAYQQFLGREPDYTNNAHVVKEEPFVETLDYIFTSAEHKWGVQGVQALGPRAAVTEPFPSEQEPSDHVLLAADLQVNL